MSVRINFICGIAAIAIGASALPAAASTPARAAVRAQPAATVDWAQDGFGPGNTGFNPSETAITTSNVAALKYRWSIVSPVEHETCAAQSPPVIASGRLFLTDQGGFAAYDATTGHRLWTKRAADPDDQITALLAVSGSTLLAATNDCQSQSDPDGTLTAYNVATGAVQWAVHRDAPIYAMIVNTGIAVVTGGDAGSDVATGYRVSNGKQAWNRTGVRTDVAVSAGGRILLTNVDGSGAVAVSVATGAKVWSTSQRWSAVAASTDGHRMFVTTPAGDLLDVYGTTGGVAWTAKGMAGAIAVDGSRVYIGHDVNLTALSWAGKLLWDDTIGFQVGRPVVAGGVLYAPQQGASLLVMKASNGAFADGNPPYAGAIGHAVVVNGRLYVTDGRVLDVFSP